MVSSCTQPPQRLMAPTNSKYLHLPDPLFVGMNTFNYSFEQKKIAWHLLFWSLLLLPVAITVGSLVALFLWLLELAGATRWSNLWLIAFLPVAGIGIHWLYRNYGKNSDAGNNLVIDEIHQPGGGIPARMTPFVLLSTLVTHLFGGSAGREGTAVQMGGSLASLFARWYRLKHADKRILLMGGMAAGFGAVFGTPVTGAIFALEVLSSGKIRYDALLPCLVASLVADLTCSAYGIPHTRYHIDFIAGTSRWLPHTRVDLLLLVKVITASVAFGLAAFLFAELSHHFKQLFSAKIKKPWLIPVAGGCLVLAISFLLGSYDYLGLGVTHPQGGVSIVAAFEPGGVTGWSWLWKLILTAITLGAGFKGGEVTPLFFIGATLGNTLAGIGGAPVDLFAALGFIAVFAGATNTPIACTLMGVELFGGDHLLYYAVACFTAYYFSGHTGIYRSQKREIPKF